MAVDFGILAQTPTIGARYAEGLQLAQAERDRNMLRQQQAAQITMQQENMLAQREERNAQAALRGQQSLELKSRMDRAARDEKLLAGLSDVLRKNGYKMDRPTLGYMAEVSMQTGDAAGAKLAMEGLRALDEREALQAAFGGQAAPAAAPSMMRQTPAATAPAAPTNMFAGTMADIGTTQPAPVNALATPPQAPAAPTGGVPSADRLRAIIADPASPKVVVDRAKAVLESLPKPDTSKVPTAIQEFQQFQKMTPAEQAAYLLHRQALQPKPPSVSLKVDNLVDASQKAQDTYIAAVAEERKSLRNAPDTLKNIDAAKRLIPTASGFMGKGGEPLLAVASFLNNRIGTSINTQGVTDATVLRTRLFEGIMDNLKKLDSQPSQEQQRVLAESLGNLGTDPDALGQILDRIGETVRDRVDRHNVDVDEAERRGVKFPFKPQIKLPGGSTGPAAIPGAPPATATQRPAAKQVLRTGKLNGRKVVEYTDGSVEYAD